MFVETLPIDTRYLLERLGRLPAIAPFYLAGGSAIPSYHLLRALAYFEDAETEPMPLMRAPLEWPTVRRFFEAEAHRLMHTLLGHSS